MIPTVGFTVAMLGLSLCLYINMRYAMALEESDLGLAEELKS